MKYFKKGFTLVEVLVVAPIVILSIGAFIALIVTLTGNTVASRGASIMQHNIQDALDWVERDVRKSVALLAVNDITLSASNPQGYRANTSGASSTGSTVNFTNVNKAGSGGSPAALVLKQFATKKQATILDANDIVYLANTPNACIGDFKKNTPLYTNVVYFINNNSLWRRTLTPANYATPASICNGPAQQLPSCDATTTHAFCKVHDTKLLEDISPTDFRVNYYNAAGSASPNTAATNSSSSDSVRDTALSLATTVDVELESSKSIAGRNVVKKASIRATRLNSTTNTPRPVPPASMQVSVFDGRKARFTWQTVPGVSTYDIDYRLNGGPWQTGATLSGNTYTVTADHTDIVEARVLARNTSGASSYRTAQVSIPRWTPLPLVNGWSDYANGYSTAAYTRTRDGLVMIKGLVKNATAQTSYAAMASLPADYAPAGRLIFGTSATPNVTARVDVATNGDLLFGAGSAIGWTSLDSITFVAANARQTKTNLPLLNGFTNYAGGYEAATYSQGASGAVTIQGLLNGGTRTAGTSIGTLPAALRPSQYMHVPSRSGGFHHMGLDVTNSLVARGDGSGAYSINTTFLPSTYTNWTDLTLQNSWVAYGGMYVPPQVTKTSDGVVHLRGLVRNGTATGVITTLPEGFRPNQRILTTIASADNYARLDIHTNGNVVMASGSNTWASLSGISFIP